MSSPPVLIRPAVRADLDAIWQLEQAAFGADPYPRFFFRQAHDLWGPFLRVAVVPSDMVAGYVLGVPAARTGEAWLLSAAVDPTHRGLGIGLQLTSDLLDVFAGHGITTVKLTVHPDNAPAVRLYHRLGFTVTAEESDYFGPADPRLLMTRVLVPIL